MERIPRRKRTRYELLADLLQSSKGGVRKTAMMYRANLSHKVLNKYLSLLIENGLIEKKGGYFFLSRRGVAYLRRFALYQHNKNEMSRSEEKIQSILTPDPEMGRRR